MGAAGAYLGWGRASKHTYHNDELKLPLCQLLAEPGQQVVTDDVDSGGGELVFPSLHHVDGVSVH